MDFNAGVREVPRLGLLGWPRTYLEIGLPLSMAVAQEEIRAILAHEFAHLSARHGRSGGTCTASTARGARSFSGCGNRHPVVSGVAPAG